LDLEMLAISTNGRERTEREFADLLAKAGLALARGPDAIALFRA
jgi:hypothetical protein